MVWASIELAPVTTKATACPRLQAVVPESVLKKRKRQEKWEEEKQAKAAAAAAAGAEKKAEAFKRAEQYVKEYREQEQQVIAMKRAARKAGTFYVEPEAKVLFVMRLRGINGMHPKTRHIMKVLRLLQMHNGVFMKVNKATMNMLVKVDPYIMYGYPNLKTVTTRDRHRTSEPPHPGRVLRTRWHLPL
eukprot:Transcript_3745.p1 GENE.Transcript_3745~~Transcript_3745.p1  ORF type:complete len:206 (-),score=63.74 Transcript_3745:710-1273(-)